MKTLLFLSLGTFVCATARGQEVPSEETRISDRIADGTVAEAPGQELPVDFDVISSITKRQYVKESPEFSDLPAVEGVRNFTIQLVDDPGLPPPQAFLEEPLPVDDPAVREQVQEASAKFREMKVLFVSATVYQGSKTLLKVYPHGALSREVVAVSNLDFNDFSGFGTFQVKGVDGEGREEIRQYALIMSIGNIDLAKARRIAERSGQHYEEPEVPEAPEGAEPAFAAITGDDDESLQTVTDLHTLYRSEGQRMKTARLAREKAYQERKFYLLANPPKPKDVLIRYWKTESQPAAQPHFQR